MDNTEFLIPLNGLPAGKTVTGRSVGKEFFESFENTEILDADLQVSTSVEKSGRNISVDCRISGKVSVPCDRCLDPVEIPVDTMARLSVKTVEGEDAGTVDDPASGREIVRVPSAEAELDMAQVIYDYVCLSLPPRRVHSEGECNEGVMRYLKSGISVSDSGESRRESPFAALGDFFRN